ncbi:unnamed protein product [Vitrella brassicaformis CCMP3155]|uniref:Uncharacterized protein n=4 Tax=Vitrella brassicaformis TaxID=1169539 RepID=A0A0G4FME8_VITBC|nr:unnamed protein product [Vitrella brassicaformis CCMP3155]|eukprot:CEM15091.1 unnamed protein product [Vitrella brassicaformis CCMP3155]
MTLFSAECSATGTIRLEGAEASRFPSLVAPARAAADESSRPPAGAPGKRPENSMWELFGRPTLATLEQQASRKRPAIEFSPPAPLPVPAARKIEPRPSSSPSEPSETREQRLGGALERRLVRVEEAAANLSSDVVQLHVLRNRLGEVEASVREVRATVDRRIAGIDVETNYKASGFMREYDERERRAKEWVRNELQSLNEQMATIRSTSVDAAQRNQNSIAGLARTTQAIEARLDGVDSYLGQLRHRMDFLSSKAEQGRPSGHPDTGGILPLSEGGPLQQMTAQRLADEQKKIDDLAKSFADQIRSVQNRIDELAGKQAEEAKERRSISDKAFKQITSQDAARASDLQKLETEITGVGNQVDMEREDRRGALSELEQRMQQSMAMQEDRSKALHREAASQQSQMIAEWKESVKSLQKLIHATQTEAHDKIHAVMKDNEEKEAALLARQLKVNNDITTRLARLEAAVDTEARHREEAMRKAREKHDESRKAIEKIQLSLVHAIEELRGEWQDFLKSTSKAIATASHTAQQYTDTRYQDCTQRLEGLDSLVKATTAALTRTEAQVADLNSNYITDLQATETRLRTRMSDSQAAASRQITQVEFELRSVVDKRCADTESMLKEEGQRTKERCDTLAKGVDGTIALTRSALENQVRELSERQDAKLTSVDYRLMKDIQERASALDDALKAKDLELSARIDAVQETFQEEKARVDARFSLVHEHGALQAETIESARKHLIEQIQDLDAKTERDITMLDERMQAKLTDDIAALDIALRVFATDNLNQERSERLTMDTERSRVFQERLENHEELTRNRISMAMEDVSNHLKASRDAALLRSVAHEHDVDMRLKEAEEKRVAYEASMDARFDTLHDETLDIHQTQEQAMNMMAEDCRGMLERQQERVMQSEAAIKADMRRETNKLCSDMASIVLQTGQLRHELTKEIAALDGGTNERFDTLQNDMQAAHETQERAMNMMAEDCRGMLERQQERTLESELAIKAELERETKKLRSDMDQSAEALMASIMLQTSTLRDELTEEITALDGRTNERFDTLQNDLQAAHEMQEHVMNMMAEDCRGMLERQQERTMQSETAIRAELERETEKLQSDMNQSAEALTASIMLQASTLRDELTEEITALDGRTSLRLEELQKQHEDETGAIRAQLEEDTSALRLEYQNEIQTLQDDMSEQMEHLYTQTTMRCDDIELKWDELERRVKAQMDEAADQQRAIDGRLAETEVALCLQDMVTKVALNSIEAANAESKQELTRVAEGLTKTNAAIEMRMNGVTARLLMASQALEVVRSDIKKGSEAAAALKGDVDKTKEEWQQETESIRRHQDEFEKTATVTMDGLGAEMLLVNTNVQKAQKDVEAIRAEVKKLDDLRPKVSLLEDEVDEQLTPRLTKLTAADEEVRRQLQDTATALVARMESHWYLKSMMDTVADTKTKEFFKYIETRLAQLER